MDRDQGGSLSASLHSFLEASDAIRPVVLEKDGAKQAGQRKAEELVQDKEWAAAVVVPAGYSERILAHQDVSLTVIANQTTPAGRTASQAVQAAVTRLLGAVKAAHISVETFEIQAAFEDEAARRAYLDEALMLAGEAWRRPSLAVTVEKAGQAIAEEKMGPQNGFTQSSPGMMVQFAIFGLITAAMVLVLERKTGALQRLLTAPITRTEVIAGHVLAMFLVVFVQQALLVAVGQLAFDVNYWRAPLATLLMMVTLAFWAACLGLLIGAASKDEEQVIMWSLVAMFVFSAMGGAWFPLEVAGKTFAAIGHFMPTAWAMDGFQNIVLRGLGMNSVLLPASILLAYAAVFFVLAVWRFRFE
jgi:ABC-2 type transport system permease protein